MRTVETFERIVEVARNGAATRLLDLQSSTAQRFQEFERAYYVTFACVVEAIKATVEVRSLGVAPFPNVAPEDTDTEATNKILEVEHKYPRYGLEFLIQADGRWLVCGRMALQNRNTTQYRNVLSPYFTKGAVLPVGRSSVLAARCVDLGWGLLKPEDLVTIQISWREEFYLILKPLRRVKGATHFGVDLATAGVAQPVRDFNMSRKILYLQNTSSSRECFISFGNSPSDAALGQGIYLAPMGTLNFENSAWQIDLPIWAIADGAMRLTGVEFNG